MNITFAPRGILQVDDAKIIYRNFAGIGGKFNREGDRNFALIIDDVDLKDRLLEEGWNVKVKPARDDFETPFMFIPVKIKFNDRGPAIYLQSGESRVKLTEETVECLDNIDITSVDLDIRPYDWEVNGKTGRSAYLQSMLVVQEVDRFAERYAAMEHPEE